MRNMELLAEMCEEELKEIEKLEQLKKLVKGGDALADILTGEKPLTEVTEVTEVTEQENDNE